MGLMEVLFPAKAPEPKGARVVSWDDPPTNSAAKLAANRRYYARHAEQQRAAERERYHARKQA